MPKNEIYEGLSASLRRRNEHADLPGLLPQCDSVFLHIRAYVLVLCCSSWFILVSEVLTGQPGPQDRHLAAQCFFLV